MSPSKKPSQGDGDGIQKAAGLDPVGKILLDLVELVDPELLDLFLPMPAHLLRILDAVAARGIPEEALAKLIGMPLDEVTEEDEAEILKAIAAWKPSARPRRISPSGDR
jgi:hypothetical protein